jgi:cytochrome c oxidase assembly protein subunit 11
MMARTKKYFIIFSIFLVIFIIFIGLNEIQKKKNQARSGDPIVINLLTSVHPKLLWKFRPLNLKVTVMPGDVTTIEYIVENIGNQETSGIATFAYFPNEFGKYIRKINCFCYDAKTLKSKEKDKYSVVLIIDPEVTKDSKTKNVKEVTIQFTFFDYKEYKKYND